MAPRTKQESAAADSADELPAPGTNVVARAKGYPPWPAMVLREADVPADVLAKKPSKKVCLPVLFYNDMSYLWVLPTEVQLLSQEQALKSSNGKIKRALKEAYAMVAESPEDYSDKLGKMLPGSEPISSKSEEATAQDVTESQNLETIMDVDEPPVSSSRARSAADQAAEQLTKTRATRARKRTVDSPAPETVKKPRKSASKPLRDAAEEEDESEYVEQSESASESYSAQTLNNSLAARIDLCQQVRTVIQDNLLVEPIKSTDAVLAAIDRIEEASTIEVAAVRRSKLHRVIVAALMQELPENIASRLSSLASQWTTFAEPVIRGIPEHLAPKEDSEAPDSRESTPRPADVHDLSAEPVTESTVTSGANAITSLNGTSTENRPTTETNQCSEARGDIATESDGSAVGAVPQVEPNLNGSSAEVKTENENSLNDNTGNLTKSEADSEEKSSETENTMSSLNSSSDVLGQ